MKYTVKKLDEVNEEMVLDMARRIDAVCFPDYCGDVAEQLAIYRLNPRTRVALFCDSELVGYVCLFPVNSEAYELITSGRLSNLKIMPEQVLAYEPGNRYHLYVDGTAILPEYAGFSGYKLLFDAVFDELHGLSRERIGIDELLAWVTNPRFERLLKRQGFRETGKKMESAALYRLERDDFPAKDR